MRTEVHVGSIRRKEVGGAVFAALLKAVPPGADEQMNESFYCTLYEDDPRLVEILALIERAGLKPWTDHSRPRLKGQEYSINKRRIYDSSDLIGFSFLELLPDAAVALDETDDGRLRLGRRRRGHSGEILREDYAGHRLIVSNVVRTVLEAADLVSVQFKPIYTDKHNTISDQWSELTSPVHMHPLAPSMHLINFSLKAEPVQPGYQEGRWIAVDGLVRPAELRYRAQDLSGWSHDLALTTEGRTDSQRRMVASRRLYDVLCDAGITTDWLPVYIDG